MTQAWHQPPFTRLRPCLCVHADWSASLVRGSARISELGGLMLRCLIRKYQSHHCAVSAGQACRRCGCQAHNVVNVVVPSETVSEILLPGYLSPDPGTCAQAGRRAQVLLRLRCLCLWACSMRGQALWHTLPESLQSCGLGLAGRHGGNPVPPPNTGSTFPVLSKYSSQV